jgi:putative membrane protein
MNLPRKLSLFAAASAFALGACADAGMTSGAGSASAMAPMPESEMPTDMRGFVTMAASSDMFEIQSSQLAKSRGVSAGVAAFADQMIKDHTVTTAAMTSMLAGMNPPMTPPTSMTAKHQAMLDKLQAAGTGDAFTRAYTQAQVMAHQEAVNLYSAYAKRGDNATLKQFAQATLPALQGHLAHAQRLNAGDMS